MVLSMKRWWGISITLPLHTLTLKPTFKPPSISLYIILLKISIIESNTKGDKESHWLKLHKLFKNPIGELLTIIENHMVEMQNQIQFVHLVPKPDLESKKNNPNSHGGMPS